MKEGNHPHNHAKQSRHRSFTPTSSRFMPSRRGRSQASPSLTLLELGFSPEAKGRRVFRFYCGVTKPCYRTQKSKCEFSMGQLLLVESVYPGHEDKGTMQTTEEDVTLHMLEKEGTMQTPEEERTMNTTITSPGGDFRRPLRPTAENALTMKISGETDHIRSTRPNLSLPRLSRFRSMEEADKGEVFERNNKSRLDSHPGATAGTACRFTDDLILEILSRIPARSLHRFKCVSVRWRDLIADPANRKKLPQTLAGFLYTTTVGCNRHHFASVSCGAAPFDPSLPYLQPGKYKDMAQVDACNGLLLYLSSSKNMVNPWAWAEDDFRFVVCNPATGSKGVFVGGMMYVIGNPKGISNEHVLLGIDMQGKVRKTVPMPYGRRFGTMGSSQGCLLYAVSSVDDNNKILDSEIELWCLKDCDSKELVLKHTASINELMSMTGEEYRVAGIHPDCDTIFLVSHGGDTLVAYDMQHQKVGCILNLEKNTQRFLPYVPLFSESLADGDGRSDQCLVVTPVLVYLAQVVVLDMY
ncbi:unnamed protein product [Triticum turgidum subsp. durum]|uniref:F-box domain-containing protein n=1 Tax=Triticum turgidum subsp. durum TaxID=4567 RepID=A0A9R0WWB3_TRITD|nr:unnamed protein product [Triticum turgidum subsp. durum]